MDLLIRKLFGDREGEILRRMQKAIVSNSLTIKLLAFMRERYLLISNKKKEKKNRKSKKKKKKNNKTMVVDH